MILRGKHDGDSDKRKLDPFSVFESPLFILYSSGASSWREIFFSLTYYTVCLFACKATKTLSMASSMLYRALPFQFAAGMMLLPALCLHQQKQTMNCLISAVFVDLSLKAIV
jgi:hypothetical protein